MSDSYDEQQFRESLPDDRKPWERMDSESDKAYHAFACYRDIEPSHERTVALAASLFYERPLDHYTGADRKPIPPHFMAWKGEFAWDLRVKQYDFFRERERMEAVQQARIEKAREEGFELAHVERLHYDTYVSLAEKAQQAMNNLDTENPAWRDVNSALKNANEFALSFYKISKFKHDMKDQEAGGLSAQDMEGFWEKSAPNAELKEEMNEMAEDA